MGDKIEEVELVYFGMASYRRQLPDAVKWLDGTRRFDEQLIAETDGRIEAPGE